MTATPTDDTLRKLRRAALDGKVEKTLAEMGLQLVHPNALGDVQRAVAAELTVDERGDTVRTDNGRFVTLYETLDRLRRDEPFLFAPGAAPTKNPFDSKSEPAFEKVVDAKRMGRNVEGIAEGKIGVKVGGLTQRTDGRPVVPIGSFGAHLEDIASGKVVLAADLGPD